MSTHLLDEYSWLTVIWGVDTIGSSKHRESFELPELNRQQE